MEKKIRVAEDQAEQNVLNHIRDHGWSIMHVFDPEYKSPNFSYSIGMFEGLQSPEVIIFSMDQNDALNIINLIGEHVKTAGPIEIGKIYKEFMKEPFVCTFIKVDKVHYKEYFGFDLWFYGSDNFPVLQCVWSDQNGKYPWEGDFNTDIIHMQPLLWAKQ